MGQWVDLVSGEVKRRYIQRKDDRTALSGAGHPLPLLPRGHPLPLLFGERGNDGLEAKLCLEAGKDRKPHDSLFTYSSVKRHNLPLGERR